MMKLIWAIGFAGLLASCQAGAGQEAPESAPAYADAPSFAQAVCGGCHALAPPDLSPNPEAPAFAEIANRPGLTEATLANFLSDAHNYPEAMEFTLEDRHVAELTAYILSLKDADYRLPPS